MAAEQVRETLDLETLLLVPCGVPPHKRDRVLAPASLRLHMLRAAVAETPGLEVSTVELDRTGPSWTVDTLRHLVDRTGPETGWTLVMGADQWADFHRWREPETIGRLARIAIMTREGQGAALATPSPPPARGVREVPVPRIDISSSSIRARIRAGRSIRFLVPDPVRRIIEAERLYLREP